jgi:hypothetical protein
MEVRDQAKLNQAREQYTDAQKELKGNYEKNLKQMQETFDNRVEKQSKNYAEHKAQLEENNQINNDFYTEKTRDAIERNQANFKNKIKENTEKFEEERNTTKNNINEKLAGISDSYKKSLDENNRYQDQIKKSLGERYTNANKHYQDDFNEQVNHMSTKVHDDNIASREANRKDRMALMDKHSQELEDLRSGSTEERFKEISRLKNDNENVRTTLTRDNQMLKDRQEERVNDLLKLKGKESADSMNKFANLQESIRQENILEQQKQEKANNKDRKDLEAKFNEDVRNIQSVAAQKIRGGTSADSVHDELKKTTNSYESRLQAAREEIARNNDSNTEKLGIVDTTYREKLKSMKEANIANLERKDSENNAVLSKTVAENREKNNSLVDRYKSENSSFKKESEERFNDANAESKNKIKDQRVEFGRVVNTINDKNIETINSLKENYSKDKSMSIEKTKKEFNDEKMAIKNEFNRQTTVKETMYEQRMADLEKEAGKIIDNYEARISQIAKKAETEVAAVKSREEARQMQESQANKLAYEGLQEQNKADQAQMRDKYENTIAKNQIMNEQKTTSLVQNYEDKLAKERADHQKELTGRLSEAQAQFERLFKSSQIERETMRGQYEQRMENMKLAAMSQDNLKKA